MRRFWLLSAAALLPVPAPAAAQDAAVPAPDSVLQAAAWLTGCWRAESPDGANAIEEVWMAPRGGLMVGMSRTIRGERARGYEFLTIRPIGDILVYHAEPSGQAPTDFPASRITSDRLEFVNAVHDFPRKIVYERRADGGLTAEVYDEVDATAPAFDVPYRPVDCASD